MRDIVERLRAYARDLGGWHNIDETCENAADEIDRLRAENARLREALEQIASGGLFQHAHEFARAALAEKES